MALPRVVSGVWRPGRLNATGATGSEAAMSIMRETTEIIHTVASLAERYDLWLCDIWGVVHNGLAAFPQAHGALAAFRRAGGTVVLITNAPRPSDRVAGQLDRLGVPRTAYDAIVSSGDVTRHLIAELNGGPIYHLGPERDLPVFEGLDHRLTDEAQAAAVVCTGLFDDTHETPEDYRAQLERFATRRLPMICANPDLVVERGQEVVYCAGALAKAYEAIGGPVAYAGKPYAPIYEIAREVAETRRGKALDKTRILAIGDGLRTDMAGAAGWGVDALFIPSAIHVAQGRPLDPSLIEELFPADTPRPVAAIQRLRW